MEPKYPFSKLDNWQKDVLKAEGNICICSGRQVGKSEIIAIKVAEYLVEHPDKKMLVISITEEQADNMLVKILLHLHTNYEKKIIMSGKKKPTKHKIYTINNSSVITKAIGQYGLGALGLTMDVIVPDECAFLPDAIWQSITPMLLTTGGELWLLSTPNAMQGYFYDAYTKPEMGFKTFHINSEDVAKGRPEPQRTIMLNYLKREKSRMTELQYAQQYLAQFLEELGQFFPEKLIISIQKLQRDSGSSKLSGEYFLGVDVARMGGDETTFEILERINNKYYQKENIMHTYTRTTETEDKILELDNKYDFKAIYIDDGGIGGAVFDHLLINDQTKRKVVAINNASKAIDKDSKRRKKLLKEDLYFNLLHMMERGQIQLLKDSSISQSLKSITKENNPDTNEVRIYGRYSHIVEGLIRAAWSSRNKSLNLYYYTQ